MPSRCRRSTSKRRSGSLSEQYWSRGELREPRQCSIAFLEPCCLWGMRTNEKRALAAIVFSRSILPREALSHGLFNPARRRQGCLLPPDSLDSRIPQGYQGRSPWLVSLVYQMNTDRSEERRVGKEWRYRRSPWS